MILTFDIYYRSCVAFFRIAHVSIQFCFIKCKEIYFILGMRSYNIAIAKAGAGGVSK